MSDSPPDPDRRRAPDDPTHRPPAPRSRVRDLERVVDAALDAAALLRRTHDLELGELRRAGGAVGYLCDALADTCGHLAHELSVKDPEPTERAHAAIEHLYSARDALTRAGDATGRSTTAVTELHSRPDQLDGDSP